MEAGGGRWQVAGELPKWLEFCSWFNGNAFLSGMKLLKCKEEGWSPVPGWRCVVLLSPERSRERVSFGRMRGVGRKGTEGKNKQKERDSSLPFLVHLLSLSSRHHPNRAHTQTHNTHTRRSLLPSPTLQNIKYIKYESPPNQS